MLEEEEEGNPTMVLDSSNHHLHHDRRRSGGGGEVHWELGIRIPLVPLFQLEAVVMESIVLHIHITMITFIITMPQVYLVVMVVQTTTFLPFTTDPRQHLSTARHVSTYP